jgi:hypothetical protein
MYFTGGLSLRKRFRSWRLGSARMWLRGHLWLGFIALPLIWMHAGNFGIEHGGMLTRVIMVLMYIVWITGIYGILLQQFMPGHLKNKIPNETLWSQIGKAVDAMRSDAARLAGSEGAIFEFYQSTVQPYLLGSPSHSRLVAVATASAAMKSQEPASSATIDTLQKMCGDYRSLMAEKRLLWWMHSWLLIHVPLSVALLFLTFIHIIMALRLTF